MRRAILQKKLPRYLQNGAFLLYICKKQNLTMQITLPDSQHLDEAAEAFAHAMGDRRVFAFYGKMGAGKTTFIGALCRHLGVSETVNSPTFALVNEYRSDTTAQIIYHFDFYRIKRIDEVYDMGFEDYFYSGALCLIEWPELAEEVLPDDTVIVHIDEQEDGTRLLTMDI